MSFTHVALQTFYSDRRNNIIPQAPFFLMYSFTILQKAKKLL